MLKFSYDLEQVLFMASDISIGDGLELVSTNSAFRSLMMQPDCLFEDFFRLKELDMDSVEEFFEELMKDCLDKRDESGYTDKVDEIYNKHKTITKVLDELVETFGYKDIWVCDETERILIDDTIFKVLNDASDLAQKYRIREITVDCFSIALFKEMPEDIKAFLEKYEIEESEVLKFFDENVLVRKRMFIPPEIGMFIENVTDNILRGQESRILGRDKEVKQIINILSKKTKRNAILVGEPGVGKSAIIELLAGLIVNGECPEEFKNKHILSLNVNSLISGTTYRGEAEERFKKLIMFIESNPNAIIFIDEVHTILGAGSTNEGSLDFANSLKPILARDDARIIGATTFKEYEKFFSRDMALKRRFEPIIVKEPKAEEIYPMIENKVAYLSKFHGVKVSKAIIKNVILYASCFNFDVANPDRTLDLLDRAMARAKNAGRKVLTNKSIFEVFDLNIEQFAKMPEETKRMIAYHEAGHYMIVRFSENLYDMTPLAVSIMPAEHYLGVTVFEFNDKVSYRKNRQYYIDDIAKSLAGRIAEKLYSDINESGASSDLREANKTATDLITKYGMSSISQKRIYFGTLDNMDLYTQKSKNQMSKEAEKIIQEGYDRALEILTARRDLLDEIVDKLCEQGILSEIELEKIIAEYENQ